MNPNPNSAAPNLGTEKFAALLTATINQANHLAPGATNDEIGQCLRGGIGTFMVQGEICSKVLAMHGEQIAALSQTLLMSTWHPPITGVIQAANFGGLIPTESCSFSSEKSYSGCSVSAGVARPEKGIYNIPIPMAPFQREPEKMRDFPARILINVVF